MTMDILWDVEVVMVDGPGCLGVSWKITMKLVERESRRNWKRSPMADRVWKLRTTESIALLWEWVTHRKDLQDRVAALVILGAIRIPRFARAPMTLQNLNRQRKGET